MIALATLLTLINQVSGTPYISGGDSPAGTDCSGLASWIANAATGRPVFGDRFSTRNEEAALAARGFHDGTAPNALVIGWNGGHTAVTLPDGTPVSSGERGGVHIGGGGAYQAQFNHHMYLPVPVDLVGNDAPPPEASAGPMADVAQEIPDLAMNLAPDEVAPPVAVDPVEDDVPAPEAPVGPIADVALEISDPAPDSAPDDDSEMPNL